MRWRRGFFRLWVVASVVLIAGAAVWGYSAYEDDHRYWLRYTSVPGPCADMQGAFGIDFGANTWGPVATEIGRRVPFAPQGFQAICWQPIGTYRRLNYKATETRSSNEVLASAYGAYANGQSFEREPTRWSYISFPAIGTAVSAMLLLVGVIIGWVLSGFRRS